jgi:hypothetical protein
MNKFLFSILASLFFTSMSAEVTVLAGTASGYEGLMAAVVGVQDEFSGKRLFLGQSEVNDAGFFEIKIDIETTQRVYVHIQRMEAPLFVQPGMSYRVVFPKKEKSDFRRFDNTEVSLQLVDFPEDDINLVIRKFNADYAAFLRDHFYDFAMDEYRGAPEYLKYRRNKTDNVDLFQRQSSSDSLSYYIERGFSKLVKSFEDSVSANPQKSSDSAFINTYKKFSCAELHLLAGMKRSRLYECYFESESVNEHNPAYAGCFNLFIRNCLVGQPSTVQSAIVKAINIDRDLSALAESINPELGLTSNRMKCLASIAALKQVYSKRAFDDNSVKLLLANSKTNDELINAIAAATLYQLERCSEGWLMQDFVFSNENQDRWKLSDADETPIYFLFFAAWSPTSIKELQVLTRWHEKLKGRVQLIAVCMDDEYKNYRRFLEENLKLPLTVLYGNAELFIHEKFNMKSIPHSMLLNAQGRVLINHSPLPSDRVFESTINRFVENEKTKTQSPRTWKGN